MDVVAHAVKQELSRDQLDIAHSVQKNHATDAVDKKRSAFNSAMCAEEVPNRFSIR